MSSPVTTAVNNNTPAQPSSARAAQVTAAPRGYNAARWTFAAVVLVTTALLICQPFLAGMHIGGDSGALNLHYLNGQLLMTLSAVQVLAALVWWRLCGGPSKAAMWALIEVGLVITQFWIGYFQYPSLHLPLGIATLFCAVFLTTVPFRSPAKKAA
ncbi:hypothetical protein ACTXN7_09060 [Corynebacterium flavescens]|uniref:hypothetical protein n=1 Tax=Corynebacterium flavescens TaxID=28028 RepID=UPI003FD43D93